MGEDQIKNLEGKLGGIYDRLQAIETMLAERCDTRVQTLKALEHRVHQLEIGRARLLGAAALLSVISSYLLKGFS